MGWTKRITLKNIIRALAVTAPIWLGLLTGVQPDHIVPLQSVVVVVVGVGYLVEPDVEDIT